MGTMKPVRLTSLPLAVEDPAAVSAFVYARRAVTFDGEPAWTRDASRVELWRMSDGTLRAIGHVFAPALADDELSEPGWAVLRCGVKRCRSEHCEVWHRLLVRREDYLRLMSSK